MYFPYNNPALPVKERVKDLVARMTIEEKIAQTMCINSKKINLLVNNGELNNKHLKEMLKTFPGRIAEIGFSKDSAKGMAELTNAIQKVYIEETRLGIPVIFHEECLHGEMASGATSFPVPIGLAGTWNADLIEKTYSLVAEEVRSRGAHHALSPVVDVAREPRWGRVEETFGEDPHLVSKLGTAAVKGFQGKGDEIDNKHVISCLKHFAAHAQPESGANCASVNVSERVLREVFFPPFKEAIQEGGAMSIMASYNEIDGIPSHMNSWLLNDILRKEWGFKGFTVSDYYAVKQLEQRHHVAHDEKDAAYKAFTTGIDIELPFEECYPNLSNLVKEGKISEDLLDNAVSRILEYKFKLGLFEKSYVDPDYADNFCGSKKSRILALQTARETITLLKNETNLLPLNINKIKSIAVIGPNADAKLLGSYSGEPNYYISLLEGIKTKVNNNVNIFYSEGCRITEAGSWELTDKIELPDSITDSKRIEEAVLQAQKADIVVMALGGNELTCREAWNEDHLGDRASLELFGKQNALLNAILAVNKNIVVFLFNGRPLSIQHLQDNVPAIFECWYLGQETGTAAADILFGDYNPNGKLPISFPRSVGHLPVYYNHKPNDRRGYTFDDISPLYPFGFGLSYTSFLYENLKIKKTQIRKNESTLVSIDVINTGSRDSLETVQMYIRDSISSVTRPVKELKGFNKIFIKSGERKTVSFQITPKELSFYDINMDYLVEPGEFIIMVGSSSKDEDLLKTVLEVSS
jgi:beta-xylosidase